ncbi:hypothetical protein MKX01_030991 [Papaver californicum]|nr:hypothetical protein MKX01_030991 [Papaver californicum]
MREKMSIEYSSNNNNSGNEEEHKILIRSNSSSSEPDLEVVHGGSKKKIVIGFNLSSSSPLASSSPSASNHDPLADGAPPEWALLLIGCLLGLATGLCVAAFNHGVHVIHEWTWAGTPNEGAAWLRIQRLADTWHRILLIPVTGGVVVGMMHGLLEIFEQINQSRSSPRGSFDLLAGAFPTIKAIQAAVTLGTGCSLGPEGPSVDIGRACANGCSELMENNRERKIALIAAGSAAGIASGFNAAVAGCFFAIETVLRPLRAENSPPFTTAMIILASVISSTVSNVLLGERPAFIVPAYELKSAAELPLYLILGMLCGVVSVVFTRLVNWFTKLFEYIKERFGLPPVVCPALGALGAGIIALKYPGVLYWVSQMLKKSYTQERVGMAATLASVCAVPLTSVLLLFELTKDYRILLPLMGAVGLAIWVPSVTNQPKENETSDLRGASRGYSSVSPNEDKHEDIWKRDVDRNGLELSVIGTTEDMLLDDLKVSQVMSKSYVKVAAAISLKEAIKLMDDERQRCVLVVDAEDLLEGILTLGDIQRHVAKMYGDESNSGTLLDVNNCVVSSVCTRGIQYRGTECGLLNCFPDTDLETVKELMEAKGIRQLPVVRRGGDPRRRKRRVVALLHYDSIWRYIREEIEHRKSTQLQRKDLGERTVSAH